MPYKTKEKWNQWNRRRHHTNKAALDRLKEQPCVDCGNRFPPYVMEFDHVPERGKKIATIGTIAGSRKITAPSVHKELAKCDLVCANCHCIRTHTRSQ